ncbi:MAG TPA: hypothetical protein VNR87_18060, partial [Flavisolibacter sp.]|nr:hypothetical protein [Flavisolibacter sp.]
PAFGHAGLRRQRQSIRFFIYSHRAKFYTCEYAAVLFNSPLKKENRSFRINHHKDRDDRKHPGAYGQQQQGGKQKIEGALDHKVRSFFQGMAKFIQRADGTGLAPMTDH